VAVVKLRDVIEGMDLPDSGWLSLLNIDTGEIVTPNAGGEVIGEDDLLTEDDLHSDAFVPLPNAEDIRRSVRQLMSGHGRT
jgi:hypothetical protein